MSSKQQQQPQHQRAPQLPSTLPFSLTSKATGSNVASTRSQSNSTNDSNSNSNSNNGNVSSGGSNRINASNGTETSTFSYDAFSATVEDQVATGTKAILKSPHISDGPGRIMNAPVPSVFVSFVVFLVSPIFVLYVSFLLLFACFLLFASSCILQMFFLV